MFGLLIVKHKPRNVFPPKKPKLTQNSSLSAWLQPRAQGAHPWWKHQAPCSPLGDNPKHAQKEDENDVLTKKRSEKVMKKYLERQKYGKVEQALEDQFTSGRILGVLP